MIKKKGGGGADKEFYPCLGVHMSLLLQKELHHLDVAIMTGHVKGCVAHLSQREKDSKLLFSCFSDTH